MPRPVGSIEVRNREKLVEATRLRRQGMSLKAIAKHTGVGERTLVRWAGAGLFEISDFDTPRAVLEQLMHDPSPNVRLGAAKILFALEEVQQDDAAPAYDSVLYDPPDYEPPPGLERPCAVLVCWT